MELSTAQSKSWMRRKTLEVNSAETSAHGQMLVLDLGIKTSMFKK